MTQRRGLSPEATEKLSRFADGMVVAVAVCLPWSTSGTAICTVIWLLALIPTIDPEQFKQRMAHPAAWLPVALFAFAAFGMLWADVSFAARLDGLDSYLKLLAIPVLLYQFERSTRGYHVFIGFLISCTLLLIASLLTTLTPYGSAWGLAKSYGLPMKDYGLPVKDYIAQSAEFTICAFGLFYLSIDEFRFARYARAIAMAVLAALFLCNIFFVIASRTSLITIPILLVFLAAWHRSWRGVTGMSMAAIVLIGTVWVSSDNVRHRLGSLVDEWKTYHTRNIRTSAGERYEFWKRSLEIIEKAPVFGHGTGTIRESFQRSAVGQQGVGALVTDNPHNQTLAVGIQLGLVGIFFLYAMWCAHFALFRGPELVAWVGIVFVVQNFVGSLFNSHLFDSTHGWLYVFGVGVAGGMMLRKRMVSLPSPKAEKTVPAES